MRIHLRFTAYILVFVLLIASACSSAARISSAATNSSVYEPPSRYDGEDIITVLYQQYSEWKGVRYRYGGLDKSGVDCSGFVHLTLKRRFGLQPPRTTRGLSEYGVAVSKNELRAGDLVFFTIGRSKRHVGIYVENDKFLHASTSRGVMLSDMKEDYWSGRYWKARRVLTISTEAHSSLLKAQ